MARWTIYDKSGNVKAITNGITVGSRTMPELEYSGTWMGECFVTLTVKSEQPVNWQIGDYLIYRGEKFVLNYDPSVVKKARRNTYGEGFVYDGVKFNSLNVEMSDVQFLDEVLSDNHIHYTSLPDFSFFAATIDDYADRLQANMNRYCLQNNFLLSEWWLILTPSRTRTVARGAGISGLSTRLGAAWDIAYQDEPSTDGEKFNQNVSISKSTVFAGLANIYNLFGLHYVTSGRTLIIGAAGKIASHVFEYGKGNGLYEIERVADSEQQLVTKLYAYGNSTNLPIRYYSNIAKVCVGKVTGIQRTGNTQLSLDTDLPYQDSYFSNRTGDIIPRALVTIRSHVITIGGGVIKRDNNTVMVSIFLKTSPDDPDWYTTDSQGLATLIQQMQVGDELIFVEGADIDKWPAGHFSYGSSIPNNLAINNLMLPGFPTQSLKAWVLANGGTLNQDGTVTWNGHTAFFSDNELAPYILSPNSAALGVREASKTWDGSDDTEDIYPTIENTGDDILVSADIITDNGVFGEGEEVPNFSVIVKGLGDDVELDSLISNSGDAAKISMKDGYCGGREFSVVSAEKVSGSTNWKLTLKRDYDEALQLYFPYSNNASIGQTPAADEAYQLRGADIAGYDGDKFVWLGIDMPSEYIEASAEKLLDAALTFLEANDYARYTYSPKVDEIYMAKQHDAAIASQSTQNPFDSLHDTLHEGNLMQFDDEDLMIDGNIFIDKLTIKEYGNGEIPTYDVTLRNHKSVGTYQRLLNTVDSLSGKGGASGIGGNGGVSTSQAKDLIKQEGDKRYIRRDINDETDTDLTANTFIAKEGVKTDTIGGKSGDVLEVEDDLQVDGGASVGGDLSVVGDTELNGDVTIGNSASDEALIKAFAKVFQQIQSNNYSGDSPFDQGWMIKNAEVNHGNASYMVVDNLFVRMKAIFTELEIRKISYAGGNIVLSHAGSTLVKVVPLTTTMQPTVVDGKLTISGNLARVENNRLILDSGTVVGNRIILDGSQEVLYAYRCYIKKDDGTTATENWWRADDQARCQTFNIDETGTYHDVSNSFYWRRVMNVGSEIPVGETTDEVMDYVDLSALDCIAGSTVPQAGDVIVQMGNRTDVSRQGFISLEVYGDDAPAFKVYKNVNGYTLNNKMPIIISPYNTSIRARRLSIETDYDVQIVPMERGDWSLIDEHKCYYYDQVQHNGSTWLCIFPEEGSGGVKYTTEEPSLEANWWKVLAQAGRDGSDGKSFNILGSYDTMAELIEAHPTGSVGDAYIVAGDLIVWDDENQQWANSGRIQGETGNGISGATIHYGTSASNTTVPTNWTANYADLPYTQGEWIWTRVVLSYTDGTSANPYYTQARIGVDGSYKSTAFTRSNKQLSATTPTGGDYSNPLPNQQTVQGEVITWSDGIPAGEAIVWATSRVFTPMGASSGWSTPRQMTDTLSNDVEFSANATKPANPSDNESERDAQGWRDVERNPSFDFTTAIWRAERTKQNGVWSAWVIEKIKGESITKTGEDVKYALSDNGTVAPQSGWQTTKPTSTDTMRWIWTRTIITWSDTSTTTLYQAERDPNDGVDGMEIVVGTQTIKYAVTTNGSTHPAEDSPLWQDTYTPVQGKWLWSKITTPYIYDGGGSAGTTVSYDVSYIAVDGAKGDKGDSVTVDTQNSKTQYVASNQGTSAPTSGWTTTIPSVPQGQFLWTKVTTVYSDGSSTVSYGVSYNAEDGADGADGTSVTITSKSVKYAVTNNGTQPADSSFTYNSIPPLELGQYLWTKTEVVYSDGNSTKAYSVSRLGTDGEDGQTGADGYTTHFAYATSADGSQGFSTTNFNGATYIGTYRDQNATDSTNYRDYTWTEWKGDKGDKGDTGRGISSVNEYYLAGTSSTTAPTGTWVTNPNNAGWNATNKYLWNYENVVYTDGTSAPTTKSVVAIWSKDGKGIDSIVNYYKASSNPNEPRPAVDGTQGWTTSIQTISPDAIYLHNYEKITYSDGSTPYRSDSHIIGHWGMDALEASQLILSPSLIAIPTDTDGVVLEDFRQEIEVSMKTYSNLLALTDVDFTANENVVVEASTLIAMAWSGASVNNGRLVNVEGSVNNGRLTISADDYAVVPSKIIVKATKGTTLTERTVSITATALDEDGNEYNGYNELTVQRQYRAEKPQFPSMVFKRSVTKPATPIGGTYTNPIPEGWEDGIPSGTGIVWASVCTFYGDGTTSGWSDPQKQIDTDNLDLEFSASSTEPAAPTGDVPFADHESEGWYDPTSPNLPEMVIWRAERKVKNGAYDGDWVVTRIYGEQGDTGANGYNTATIMLYKRSSTPITSVGITGDCTYNFETKALSGNLNNWSRTIPTDSTNEIYVTAATANSREITDTIGANEWAAPAKMAANGAHGINTATVFLYARNATAPIIPYGSHTYTFSTGVLSGDLGVWSQIIPVNNGQPCWVIQATALSDEATDTIERSEWSSPNKLVEDGASGADGVSVYLQDPITIFTQSMDDPSVVSSDNPKTYIIVKKGNTTVPLTQYTVAKPSTIPQDVNCNYTVTNTTSEKSVNIDTLWTEYDADLGTYYPCEEGYAQVIVTYDGVNYTLNFKFLCNNVGKFKTKVKGDVETSIANKTWYEYNPATGQYDKETTMGEFIRSSSQNTSKLTETENDTISAMSEVLQKVDNISLTVYENKEGIDLFTHTDDVVVGTSWTTIPTTNNTTDCKTMCVSIPMEIEKKSADSTINFRIYTKNTSGGATIDTIIQFCTFNNGVLTSTGNKSRFDAITSYVRDSKEYVKGVLYFEKTQSSTFKMVDVDARNTGTTVSCTLFKSRKFSVGVSLKDGLVGTGIDIVNGKITMTADKFECQNNSGVKTAWLDDMGNFTTMGVYNNLATIISFTSGRLRNTDKIISWVENGVTYWCLDVLRCGDVVVIESLPSDFTQASNTLWLPFYFGDTNEQTRMRFMRTKTRNGDSSTATPHLITAAEMKQLVGKRMVVIIQCESTSILKLSAHKYTPNGLSLTSPTLAQLAGAVNNLANGQDVASNIEPQDISIQTYKSIQLECKYVWNINNGGDSPYAYIWTRSLSDSQDDNREDDIDSAWT